MAYRLQTYPHEETNITLIYLVSFSQTSYTGSLSTTDLNGTLILDPSITVISTGGASGDVKTLDQWSGGTSDTKYYLAPLQIQWSHPSILPGY
jgi:hypothetical protein